MSLTRWRLSWCFFVIVSSNTACCSKLYISTTHSNHINILISYHDDKFKIQVKLIFKRIRKKTKFKDLVKQDICLHMGIT